MCKVFREFDGVSLDTRRMTFVAKWINEWLPVESFRGRINNYEILGDGLDVRHFNLVATRFDLPKIRIQDGNIYIPVSTVVQGGRVMMGWDTDQCEEPQIELIDETPEMIEYPHRAVTIIKPNQLQKNIPGYVRLYSMIDYHIVPYDPKFTTMHHILIEDVTASFIFEGAIPDTVIKLTRPFENSIPRIIVVEKVFTITDSGGVNLKESILTCRFPLRLIIKQDDELALRASFDTYEDFMTVTTLRMVEKLPPVEILIDDHGRYVFPLSFLLIYYRSSPNSLLEFINESETAVAIELITNPKTTMVTHHASTNISGKNGILSVTCTCFPGFEFERERRYAHSFYPGEVRTYSFYSNLFRMCIDLDAPLDDFTFYDDIGRKIPMPMVGLPVGPPLTKTGKYYLPLQGTKYMKGIAKYIRPIFLL